MLIVLDVSLLAGSLSRQSWEIHTRMLITVLNPLMLVN